jgi:hypothetical protein
MIVHALSLTALSPLLSLKQLMMHSSLDIPLEQLFSISDCSLLILSLHKQSNIMKSSSPMFSNYHTSNIYMYVPLPVKATQEYKLLQEKPIMTPIDLIFHTSKQLMANGNQFLYMSISE